MRTNKNNNSNNIGIITITTTLKIRTKQPQSGCFVLIFYETTVKITSDDVISDCSTRNDFDGIKVIFLYANVLKKFFTIFCFGTFQLQSLKKYFIRCFFFVCFCFYLPVSVSLFLV